MRYQGEIFANNVIRGEKPLITKDPLKLEEQAKKVMKHEAYSFVAAAAGERATVDANRQAFSKWRIVPRFLTGVLQPDTSVTLFGRRFNSPILCAPVGVQSVYHPDGAVGMAEIAGQLGITYCQSTVSSSTIEDVAVANDKGAGGSGVRWFQLYWPYTDDHTASLLHRAKTNGYEALIVTLDSAEMAWRPYDLDNAFSPFHHGHGSDTGFTDPSFRATYAARSGGKAPEEQARAAAFAWHGDIFLGATHTWDDLKFLRERWEGPILLKGLQHPDDAVKAYEHGMDGIVVSNHGGRQLDGATGSLDMLPEIVEAVKGLRCKTRPDEEFTVLFDSGVRTGADIIKALCLGAKAVLIGRPWIWGLGIGGKEGAKEVLRGLLADVDLTMTNMGVQRVSDLSPTRLRRA